MLKYIVSGVNCCCKHYLVDRRNGLEATDKVSKDRFFPEVGIITVPGRREEDIRASMVATTRALFEIVIANPPNENVYFWILYGRCGDQEFGPTTLEAAQTQGARYAPHQG